MPLCDEAREIVTSAEHERAREISEFLEACESPVEQIFLAALAHSWQASVNPHYRRLQCQLSGLGPWIDDLFTLLIEPQKELRFAERTYRADVLITITRLTGHKPDPVFGRLVVEIDGHDFHERTKAQASYDKRRDREMLYEGYAVVRFTGSDIFHSPYEAVEEVQFQLGRMADDVVSESRKNGQFERLLFGE